MRAEFITQDLVVTDGDKYSVILENERVRVLRYHDKPGDRTLQHAHPDYLLYAESFFKRCLTFPDGRKQEVDVKKGSRKETNEDESIRRYPIRIVALSRRATYNTHPLPLKARPFLIPCHRTNPDSY